jgi:hypothetical protein
MSPSPITAEGYWRELKSEKNGDKDFANIENKIAKSYILDQV